MTVTNHLDRYRMGVQKVLHAQENGTGILFPKQTEILRAEAEWIADASIKREEKRTAYYKVPTGGGKTVLFSKIIDATRDTENDLPLRTLIVVPTKRLITQTNERMYEFAPDLDTSFVDGNFKEYYGDEVIITTYASLIAGVRNGKFNPEDFGLLILDEAHNALGEETSEIVKRFKTSIIRGFTATPEFDDLKNLELLLGYEIYNLDIPDAVQDGLLSSFKSIIVHSTKSVDFDSIGYAKRDYSQKKLERAINNDAAINTALDLYLNYRDSETGERFFGKKLRLNCISIDHANAAASAFHDALKKYNY